MNTIGSKGVTEGWKKTGKTLGMISHLKGSNVTNVAEGEGFEPSIPCGIPLFESGQFNHSCIPPTGLL